MGDTVQREEGFADVNNSSSFTLIFTFLMSFFPNVPHQLQTDGVDLDEILGINPSL